MHPNAALVARFYEAFQRRDADAMAACYHADATFSDPVFPDLRGPRVAAMWRMLCASARDLDVRAHDIQADDATGSARWEARYGFGRARRPVHNVIAARFAFRDGRIARHEDSFDLWRWSRMALGPAGVALGWSPMLKARIRADAARRLDAQLQR